MLNALLIQLFGREVMDRLQAAGFESAVAIASAGAERLSEAGGIPPALARRIVAVAMEEPEEIDLLGLDGPAPIPAAVPEAPATDGDAKTPAPPAPAESRPSVESRTPSDPAERHVRRPFRRPHSSLAAKIAHEKESDPEPKEAQPRPDAASDPFVDDVGLVAWMGSAVRGDTNASASFTVADEILDPGPPLVDVEPAVEPAGAPPARTAPQPAAPEPAAPKPPSEETPVRNAPPGESPRARARRPILVEGSFWSFGVPKKPGETGRGAVRSGGGGSAERGAGQTPRRRSHDGH